MSIWTLEESHPKIVVVHLRDAVRTMSERGASFLKRGDHHCDVRTAKIDAALCFEVGRVICFLEEQTYSRTVKERQVIEPIQFRNVHNLNLKAAYEQAGAIVGKKSREASVRRQARESASAQREGRQVIRGGNVAKGRYSDRKSVRKSGRGTMTKSRSRIYLEGTRNSTPPRQEVACAPMWHQQGRSTDDIKLTWTAMVLLPNQEWAAIKCDEGRIREHTLH